MEEIDIVGFDGQYTITTEGDVFSYKYKNKRKLKPQKASQSKKGYFQVRLFTGEGDKLGTLYYIHRLVWETHVGPIPEDMQIDHIDTDTTNNTLNNLQLLSQRDNMIKYNVKRWGSPIRERRDEFIKLYEELGSYKEVSRATGISVNRLYRVIRDRVHYFDRTDNKFKTKRYNPSLNDKYTAGDRRTLRFRERDEKGRFMPD